MLLTALRGRSRSVYAISAGNGVRSSSVRHLDGNLFELRNQLRGTSPHALQMHHNAGAVLQPGIASADAVRVYAREIGDAGEFVDHTRGGDLRQTATRAEDPGDFGELAARRAKERANEFEWIGSPLIVQQTVAAGPADDKVFADGHRARGRQAGDPLLGWRRGAAGHCNQGRREDRFAHQGGTSKCNLCHLCASLWWIVRTDGRDHVL